MNTLWAGAENAIRSLVLSDLPHNVGPTEESMGATRMELIEARSLATDLMAQHGLTGWRLVFDNAKMRAGVCRPGRREIGLSRVLTGLHTRAEVRDTILHEIAHALVGPSHGHDAVWRAKALAIGSTGGRCVPESAARADAPWAGVCPAGHEFQRHRRPTRVMSCSRCSARFGPGTLITWRFHGRAVPMHPRYQAELAGLRARGSDGAAAASTALTAGGRPSADGWPPSDDLPTLPVGASVVVSGSGRYAGLVGIIEKRGRTRYHVRTRIGLLTVPFATATATAIR